MTIQRASVAAAPTQHRRRYLSAAAGALLVLTAAAGIGAWQLGRDSGTNTGEQPSTAVPVPAPVRTSTGRTGDTAPTYYLVASPAQAAAVETELNEANALRATAGEPALAARVQQLGSAAAEREFREAISTGDATRAALGLPQVSIVDLR